MTMKGSDCPISAEKKGIMKAPLSIRHRIMISDGNDSSMTVELLSHRRGKTFDYELEKISTSITVEPVWLRIEKIICIYGMYLIYRVMVISRVKIHAKFWKI